jgi:hypothetical protein
MSHHSENVMDVCVRVIRAASIGSSKNRFCSRRVVSGRARTGREPQADKMRRLAKAFCTPSLCGNKNNSINQEQ